MRNFSGIIKPYITSQNTDIFRNILLSIYNTKLSNIFTSIYIRSAATYRNAFTYSYYHSLITRLFYHYFSTICRRTPARIAQTRRTWQKIKGNNSTSSRHRKFYHKRYFFMFVVHHRSDNFRLFCRFTL